MNENLRSKIGILETKVQELIREKETLVDENVLVIKLIILGNIEWIVFYDIWITIKMRITIETLNEWK